MIPARIRQPRPHRAPEFRLQSDQRHPHQCHEHRHARRPHHTASHDGSGRQLSRRPPTQFHCLTPQILADRVRVLCTTQLHRIGQPGAQRRLGLLEPPRHVSVGDSPPRRQNPQRPARHEQAQPDWHSHAHRFRQVNRRIQHNQAEHRCRETRDQPQQAAQDQPAGQPLPQSRDRLVVHRHRMCARLPQPRPARQLHFRM